ncbi:hypothetical protein acsn021_29470 [Anaerocolumna cellulosilytica]|uniref:Uncharacterized protein n=1 Tax=Anaerocolumna cellulosilytica TaxID=433286 RepID=A0A6S6R8T1_9FIRM|nr:DUF2752 domain-containing protein [Anaerocolumna cellulosilytica]MBB5197165.1 hypothetical protein [Anaerocolumna cellulosilytica]BCJ95378.1 hypothetical protein acsn021_29470 [Anaerocolumna cellulosilytica]
MLNIIVDLIKRYWIGIVLCIIVLPIINFLFGTVCLSTLIAGIPCPTCGITRATGYLLTGRVKESMQMHPLLFLIIGGFILYIFLKKNLKNYRFFIKFYVILCTLIFFFFYIYRMQNEFPNTAPMVYNKDNVVATVLKAAGYIK